MSEYPTPETIIVEAVRLDQPTSIAGPDGTQFGDVGDYLVRCIDGALRIVKPEDWPHVAYGC